MTRQQVIALVSALKPGQAIAFSREMLRDIRCIDGTPEQHVLDGITGSAYEFYTLEDREKGRIIFHRLKSPLPADSGLRASVSWDRAHWYRQRPDGLFELNPQTQHLPQKTPDPFRFAGIFAR